MTAADLGLQRDIDAVVAIDDHGHPLPVGAEDVDHEHPINPYDHALSLRERPTNPEYLEVWRALWDYRHDDFDDEHLRELIEHKQAIQARPDYESWLFDRLHTESLIYIGTAPEPGLPSPWFRWCPHLDWMLWPFRGVAEPGSTLVTTNLELNRTRRRDAGYDGLPGDLGDYLAGIVDAGLERCRDDGAVGVKFNTAYYRPIRFDRVPADDAAALYRRARDGELLGDGDHRAVQDHVFRHLVDRAGRLGLPVQVHTGIGARPHFTIADGNPLLFESTLVDTPHTNFVLLHAGWPFDREATACLAHDNAHLDLSEVNHRLFPRRLADLVRADLEWFPEKILYGSDAHSDRSLAKLSGVPPRPNPLAGWEEKAWLADRTTRDALAIALSGMLDDREIDADGAQVLARGVLRDNARTLYPRLDS